MIGAIEQAILDRLTAASAVLGYSLRRIATYGGELQNLTAAVNDFPAVWTVYTGEDAPVRLGPAVLKRRLKIEAIVAVKSARNEKAARHGVTGEAGSYQVVDDLIALLTDFVPAGIAGAGRIEAGEIRSIEQAKAMSLYGLTLFVPVTFTLTGAGTAVDLSLIHLDWDVPGGETVAAPLPAAHADRRDDINLEAAP